jgi:hypothetical protein
MRPRSSAPSALLSSLLSGGLMCAALPAGLAGIFGGVGFFGGDPWLRTINEFQPLFFQGRTGIREGFCNVGGGGLLLVPLIFTAARRRDRFEGTLALFAAVYLLGALTSLRFMVCAGPLLAVAGALVVARHRSSLLLAATGAVLLLAPSLSLAVPALRHPAPPVGPEAEPFYRASAAIHAVSPVPRRVLGPWSWGHVFEFVGEQAPVVDGFGSSIGTTDFDDALGVVLLPSEDHVAAYCRDNGIRYVVLDNPFRRLTVQAQAIGLSPDFFVGAPPGGGPVGIRPLMRFSFWWRAYFDRGQEIREPRRRAPAFRHFRLFYADPRPAQDSSRFRGPAVEVWELTDPS